MQETDSIPELERSPGEENGNTLQYSCLGNPMNSKPGGLQSMGLEELDTTEQLSTTQHRCFLFKAHIQETVIHY